MVQPPTLPPTKPSLKMMNPIPSTTFSRLLSFLPKKTTPSPSSLSPHPPKKNAQPLTPLKPIPIAAEKKENIPQINESVTKIPLKCLQNPENGKDFICCLCKCICVDPVELCCESHKKVANVPLYCKECLLRFMKSNRQTCPLSRHKGVDYKLAVLSSREERKMKNMPIYCPNGSQFSLSFSFPSSTSRPPFGEWNVPRAFASPLFGNT